MRATSSSLLSFARCSLLLEGVQTMVLPRGLVNLGHLGGKLTDFTRQYTMACLKLIELNGRLSDEAIPFGC